MARRVKPLSDETMRPVSLGFSGCEPGLPLPQDHLIAVWGIARG